ncbi:MAG: RraA family protein [Candidatus Latescibacteria bacterium]|jgi:regulator of RNase E activity RraA|nr:RraA family protein [Candidatus Latescibacterota bacterium]
MTELWNSDIELFELARKELFTAVLGDVMDTMGLKQQFLPPAVQPLETAMVVVGRAMTVLVADCVDPGDHTSSNGEVMNRSFGLMLDALDDLKPGEIYVCAGASPNYALWGELMSTRAMKLGAVGAVLDGFTRDTLGILEMRFPVFCHGQYGQDQGPRGKVVDFRVPVEMGGTRIEPGDILVGDVDGVCVVPRHVEDDVFTAALEKVRGENLVREALEAGMSATEAFEKYGIL